MDVHRGLGRTRPAWHPRLSTRARRDRQAQLAKEAGGRGSLEDILLRKHVGSILHVPPDTLPATSAVDLAAYDLGGRLVLVGIPSDDQLQLKHSNARRKGLTILLCRRMKHTYPRAISLTERRVVDLHHGFQPASFVMVGSRRNLSAVSVACVSSVELRIN